jgi:tetratricopeptide (TPR) repeat protein
MKRFIGFLTLTFLICVVASQTFVSAQDKVERRDKKGNSTFITGKILEENAAGVKIKPQGLGKEEMVPSSDIVRMTYSDLPAKASLDIGKMAAAETARDFPALLKGYEAIQAQPEVKTSGPAARRYIDFRVVTLRAAVAEGDDQLKTAIKGLSDFLAANADCWEYPHVARQLARLQSDTGDYPGATKTYESLEKAPNVPTEFKQEATAALIDIAFQSERYDEGQKRIESVLKDPMASAALKARVDMYQLGLDGAKGDLAAAVKKIEDAIAKTGDNSLRALGYNVLGDLYLAKKQPRDAMWSYLWVDVVYNQDRGEHLKAMTRLIKIFDETDKDKAALYKEKVARSR